MLSKKERINRQNFKKVTLKSKKLEGDGLSARIHYLSNDQKPRFSAIISSKILSKAVLRNRQKRRIYSAISSLKKEIKALNKGFLMAIYLKKEAKDMKTAQIKDEIVKILKKL